MQAVKEAALNAYRIGDGESSTARAMIRLKEVMKRTGKSRTTIWRNVRAGTFPAPVSTGPQSIAWFEDEVQEWQDSLKRVWQRAEAEAA